MHYQEANFQGLSYLVRYPEGFDPTRPCPTLLFLHGAGTRGSDMQLLMQAQEAAQAVLSHSVEMDEEEHRLLQNAVRTMLRSVGDRPN